nr:hypothetical protein B0A51_00402 [Rachicladosporium sp. CCFEE 5018]
MAPVHPPVPDPPSHILTSNPQYRPGGRSGRSGRSQADNDIFEGLPVKQWTTLPSRVSLAPPVSEATAAAAQDKWADLPMPRDHQLLLPHTQALLRIARSGKFGAKRKAQTDGDADGDDYGDRDDVAVVEEVQSKAADVESRGFIAKKWQPTPEASLVPEHLHWEFLAKRRKGLPSFYHGLATEVAPNGMPQIAKRKTRVQRLVDIATGESVIYEVLALEGQVLENELPPTSELAATPVAPGTVIEGLGTANDEGLIVVVPVNAPTIARRIRAPPKKKGGPGRGKKRVTFTNPDGSTYTTIVPNATKIVPAAGQTVKHIAKGEAGGREVTLEEARELSKVVAESTGTEGGGMEVVEGGEGEGEGEGEGDGEGEDDGDDDGDDDEEDDDDEEGDEDDDREEGEIADPGDVKAETEKPEATTDEKLPDTNMIEEDADAEMQDESVIEPPLREKSSSPDLPLAQTASSHSRQNSTTVNPVAEDNPSAMPDEVEAVDTQPEEAALEESVTEAPAADILDDGEEDLLGSLERDLEG